MTNLQKLYQTIQNLKELGLPLSDELLSSTARLEEEIITKEILPALSAAISPHIEQIQRELTLEVRYIPEEPLSVRLIRGSNDEPTAPERTEGLNQKREGPEETERPERKTFTMAPHTKSGRSGLRVTLPDGSILQHQFAYQTLMEVVRLAGHRKVAALGLVRAGVPLVSYEKDDFYSQHQLESGVYVMTHSATRTKAEHIEAISEALGLGLRVEVV